MLFVFAVVFLFSTLFYCFILWQLVKFWKVLPDSRHQLAEFPALTVLIPARNEASNILTCLELLYSQDYPANLLEVILVDDHSLDNTVDLVSNAHPQCVIVFNSTEDIGKKYAIINGVTHATNNIIVCLDADCIPASKSWLKIMVSNLVMPGLKAITAPVIYSSNAGIWQNLEATENLSMMLITGAAYSAHWFHMSNGANLAFYKKDFLELNPYIDNVQLASGDDMFLFEKIESVYPGKTGFVKNQEAIVITKPQATISAYISQRIRWGTKNKSLKSTKMKMLLGFIFLQNALMLLAVVALILSLNKVAIILASGILIKFISDYYLLKASATYFNQKKVLRTYLFSAVIYPVLLFITGILSLIVKRYHWKERKME